jgi:hypothetical protein
VLEDEAVVEVVLRLIDQQRAIAVDQQDGQDGGVMFSRNSGVSVKGIDKITEKIG